MNGTTRYSGGKLGKILEAQGRKRRWLAQQVGVSESFISKAIAGQRTFDQLTADRIALALGMPFFLVFEFRNRNESISLGEVEPMPSDAERIPA